MPHQTDTTVGIDIGTTSVKAVAVDRAGKVLRREQVHHQLLIPGPGLLEHDPDKAWRRGPRRALRAVSTDDTRAVAVSAMVPSLAAVDARGKPYGPGLLYGDARGQDRVAATAAGISANEAANFLGYLSREEPGAAGYWPAQGVANAALGSAATLDYATALTCGRLFRDGGWDADLCASVGVTPEALPGLAVMGAPIGNVRHRGGVLAAGSVDVFCEQLVSGADQVGDVLVLCGTTLIVWIVTGEQREVDGLWCVPNVTSGRWMTGGASNGGGLFLNWLSRVARKPARGTAPLDPDDLPVWSPYIRGERTPFHDPDRRAALHGLGLTHTSAHLQRAAWEATAFVVRHHIDLVGAPVRRVVAVGGGTRVDGWMQALADGTGLPVDVAADAEGAARGAAYLAGMAVGHDEGASFQGATTWARTARTVQPDARWQRAASDRYTVFRELAATSATADGGTTGTGTTGTGMTSTGMTGTGTAEGGH